MKNKKQKKTEKENSKLELLKIKHLTHKIE